MHLNNLFVIVVQKIVESNTNKLKKSIIILVEHTINAL